MKPALERVSSGLYHIRNGLRIGGPNPDMRGGCTGLRGDCSGLSGDCTGLIGNLDALELTDEDRERGVNIQACVKK